MPPKGVPMAEEHKAKIAAANRKPVAPEKACTACGEVKPRGEFGTRGGNPRRIRSECRPCERAAWRQWRRDNPEKVKRQQREADLRIRYGMTVEEYEALEAAQGGVCAICGQAQGTQGRSKLAVDHCHETGRRRGLLCDACNKGVGHFGDDPGALRRAADYLDRWHVGGTWEDS